MLIDYTLFFHKAEECLKREKERVGHYLHISSEQKLLEVSWKFSIPISYYFFVDVQQVFHRFVSRII
jgi:hypothetical protein